MARGPRLPKDAAVRPVPNLFPDERPATAEQLAFYRALLATHGPYVFAVDRQSDKAELTRADHTGQIRRVEAIRALAKAAGYLAEPVAVLDRAAGELPFLFDRHVWFIDGETKNATGYAANENARPEFWRAYLLACALGREGCGPAAFIVGEATRFFRDPTWLQIFHGALAKAGVRLFVGGFGEVTLQTLPGLQAMINALSSWLPEVLRGARAARQRAGKLTQRKGLHLAVLASADGAQVVANPAVWPLLAAVCEELADGRLTTIDQATRWLAERGVRRCPAWLQQLFQTRPILDGFYDAYRMHYVSRQLKSGPLYDLDMTPGGYRRYLCRLAENPLNLPIQFAANGQQPISPEVLCRARRRITGAGRPETRARPPGLFLSGRYTRCAVCGLPIVERVRTHRHCVSFYVVCSPPHPRISSRPTPPPLVAPAHQRMRAIEEPLSAHVWRVLVSGVEGAPLEPAAFLPDEAETEARLAAQLAGAQADLDRHMEGLGMVLSAGDAARASYEKRLVTLADRVTASQQAHQAHAAGLIDRRRESAAFRQFQQILRHYHTQLTDTEKGELIESVVERIVVHPEECWFRIDVRSSVPALQGLMGQWGVEPIKITPSSPCINFRTSLRGSWREGQREGVGC